jgi:hypothetical protein
MALAPPAGVVSRWATASAGESFYASPQQTYVEVVPFRNSRPAATVTPGRRPARVPKRANDTCGRAVLRVRPPGSAWNEMKPRKPGPSSRARCSANALPASCSDCRSRLRGPCVLRTCRRRWRRWPRSAIVLVNRARTRWALFGWRAVCKRSMGRTTGRPMCLVSSAQIR